MLCQVAVGHDSQPQRPHNHVHAALPDTASSCPADFAPAPQLQLPFPQLTQLQLLRANMDSGQLWELLTHTAQLQRLHVLDTPHFTLTPDDHEALQRLPRLDVLELSGSEDWDMDELGWAGTREKRRQLQRLMNVTSHIDWRVPGPHSYSDADSETDSWADSDA